MADEIKLRTKLIRQIEEEKGLSWKKVMRIVELYALCNEVK